MAALENSIASKVDPLLVEGKILTGGPRSDELMGIAFNLKVPLFYFLCNILQSLNLFKS